MSTAAYSGTAFVEEEWSGGVCSRTSVTLYSNPDFQANQIREAITNSYGIAGVYVAILGLFVTTSYFAPRTRISANVLSACGAVVLLVALAAIAYPAATMGAAAAGDVDPHVNGFVGSAVEGQDEYSWGVGAAWGLWAAATLLTMSVVLVPVARRRRIARAARRTWRHNDRPEQIKHRMSALARAGTVAGSRARRRP